MLLELVDPDRNGLLPPEALMIEVVGDMHLQLVESDPCSDTRRTRTRTPAGTMA